ncbi:MAG: zinc-ribbon and DUF3426 domain-containing protein [Proteobacteria bacterium]|nr:zinc-ribbon and DUF3426 domain-containing protein [Pseudomonadota bacterium]
MFTVCPKCALTLAVTAADLRVAQGYVRCGRCASVFNALARLSDERQADTPQAQTPATPPASPETAAPAGAIADEKAPDVADSGLIGELPADPPPPATGAAAMSPPQTAAHPNAVDEPPPRAGMIITSDDTIPEGALEFNPAATDVTALFVEPPPSPQWTAATGSFRAMVAANQEAQREPHATAAATDLDPEFLATLGRQPRPAARASNEESAAAADTRVPRSKAATDPAPLARPAAPVGAAPAPVDEPIALADESIASVDEPAGPALAPWRRPAPWWRVGSAVALLVLVLQVVNHRREDLAARPAFNHVLTSVYAALGAPLVPHWDVHAYDVRQLGASVDTAGAGLITVRASIQNSGHKAQPLPLLRVTLQDRFGNRVAARDVEPRSYLPAALSPAALLDAGQRIDTQMSFVDPGKDAVGFELDACLAAAGGALTCASDNR